MFFGGVSSATTFGIFLILKLALLCGILVPNYYILQSTFQFCKPRKSTWFSFSHMNQNNRCTVHVPKTYHLVLVIALS